MAAQFVSSVVVAAVEFAIAADVVASFCNDSAAAKVTVAVAA
jgi:hypothetical protein